MVKINKGSEPITVPYIKTLIYGPPGLGKTTYALSSDNPLLLDFDRGIQRVQPRERKDYVSLTKWIEVEEILKESTPYSTMIIDTAGKCLDILTVDIIENAPPKSKIVWNGNLTQQGYGVLRNRFKTFLAQCEAQKKNLIFVSHDKETQDGDITFVRPDIQGSSQAILMREMDLIGYMSITEGKTMISFDPSDKYYGKNSCMLPRLMECSKFPFSKIIETYHANQDKIQEVLVKYNELIANINFEVNAAQTPEQFMEASKKINTFEHIWDSKLQAKTLFFTHINKLGYEFDSASKTFVVKTELPPPLVP